MQPARPAQFHRSAGALQTSRQHPGPRVLASGRLVSPAAQQADVGSGTGSTATATATATAVAPASDVHTRQLRLLPWQTSASISNSHDAGSSSTQQSESLHGSDGNASSSSSEAAARSSAVATTLGAASSGEPRVRQQPRRGAAPSGTANTAGSISSIDAADNGDASSSSGSGGSPRGRRSPLALAAASASANTAPLASTAAAACEVCGGKRFILSRGGSSGGSVQPCEACQQWRQRPDFRPGSPLLTLQDVNLAALDAASSSAADGGSSEAPSGSGSAAGAAFRKPRRKLGPMSMERKQAISRALQSKGAKSEEHKRSISRAMREAHARNPQLRHSAAGQKKKCGHCGQEGHNRKTCPQLLAAASAKRQFASGANLRASGNGGAAKVEAAAQDGREAAGAVTAPAANRLIVIEVDDSLPLPLATVAAAEAADAAASSSASAGGSNGAGAVASDGGTAAAPNPAAPTTAAAAAEAAVGGSALGHASPPAAVGPGSSPPQATVLPPLSPPLSDLLPTVQLGPGLALSPEGGWVFPLPQSKEECVAQAAQAVLRAWDDGIRRQALELLLPQADPTEDGGWPGGIRQQFRVAKPMVESLLLRLKQYSGLEGRITAEFLDEGDCVGAWQSERLAAVLFATADTLPDLRRIDDALSGKRLTLVMNPQWQTQGQVISDFGFGKARKSAERFVAAFEDVYYLRRVRIFGDDVRIMRCYPGQWQVHYVPPDPRAETVLLSCEDGKPTFQRLIQLLKAVRGSRASKTWLDRFLTSSMGTFNEFATFSPEAAAMAADSYAHAYGISGSGGARGAGGEGADGAAGGSEQALWPRQAAEVATEVAAGAGAGRDGPQVDPTGAGSATASSADHDSSTAGAGADGAEQRWQRIGPLPARDIVTGEVLPEAGSQGLVAESRSRSGGASRAAGDAQLPSPVRDVRLEPVNQIAKWLP